jgi:hypothetical protein
MLAFADRGPRDIWTCQANLKSMQSKIQSEI